LKEIRIVKETLAGVATVNGTGDSKGIKHRELAG
jgi:hypothetical protein